MSATLTGATSSIVIVGMFEITLISGAGFKREILKNKFSSGQLVKKTNSFRCIMKIGQSIKFNEKTLH